MMAEITPQVCFRNGTTGTHLKIGSQISAYRSYAEEKKKTILSRQKDRTVYMASKLIKTRDYPAPETVSGEVLKNENKKKSS